MHDRDIHRTGGHMKKVLIIDDDPVWTEALTTLLTASGYEVCAAPNGREGFEKALICMPAIILLDVMMAHKSEGFDIAQHLHQDPKTRSVPVIMVTGIRKDMELPFGFEPHSEWLPVKAVLEKPVKPKELLDVIQRHLRE
jgi:CheY-like chemotaxis protein